jgi:hypothetical protein
MHEHCRIVALLIPQLAMGRGSSGKVASLSLLVALDLLKRRARSSTSLGRCPVRSSSLSKVTALFRPLQPVFDDAAGAPLEYHAHSFLVQPFGGFAIETYTRDNTPISPEEIRKCQTKSGSKHLKTDLAGEVELFYRKLSCPAVIGMEAVGNSQWFLQMLQRLGHRHAMLSFAKASQLAELVSRFPIWFLESL